MRDVSKDDKVTAMIIGAVVKNESTCCNGVVKFRAQKKRQGTL